MKLRLVTLLVSVLTISTVVPSHAWDVESSEDDFGSTVVFAKTYFMQDVGNTDSFDEAYENGDYESLIIRCQDKKLEAYMTTLNNEFDNSSSAMVRFGGGSAKKWSVGRSTSKTGLFFNNSRTFVTSLLKVKKFYVRASGSTGYLTANFDVGGLSSQRSIFKSAGCKF